MRRNKALRRKNRFEHPVPKIHEFRVGDLVKVKTGEFSWLKERLPDTYRVKKITHISNKFDDYWFDEDHGFAPQTMRQSVGHSQHLLLHTRRGKHNTVSGRLMERV